jgi:adenine phosphoribosyltransferase
VRKIGKLPWKTRQQRYQLEYGGDGIEIHEDAMGQGTRVVLVDDLLATGGTAAAACSLLQGLGADVVLAAFVIELAGLNGRAQLAKLPVEALISYP